MKNVKLTEKYTKAIKAFAVKNNMTFATKKLFFYCVDKRTSEGERVDNLDIQNDNTNVPVYDIDNNIIRHEGSNANPATPDIVFYSCNEEEVISMPSELADLLISNGTMEEVI